MPFKGLDASDITALAATVAALAAVGVSVWDNVQQRRFYRVSVMPQLDYSPRKEGGSEGSVVLTNEGNGPAEIRALRIGFCGDGERDHFGSWNQARPTLAAMGLRLTGYHDLRAGEVIGSGQAIDWLRFESAASAPAADPVQGFIDAFSFRIQYSSVYDESFRLARRPECLRSGSNSDG